MSRWKFSPLILMLSLVLAHPAVAQICWTSAGASGSVAGDDLEEFNHSGSNLVPRGTAPLPVTVTATYSITGIFEDDGSVLRAKRLLFRYRDNGPEARIVAELRQVNIWTGAATLLATFDSDAFPQSSSFQLQGFWTACALDGAFSAADYSYFVKVDMTKSGSGGTPALQIIQACAGNC